MGPWLAAGAKFCCCSINSAVQNSNGKPTQNASPPCRDVHESLATHHGTHPAPTRPLKRKQHSLNWVCGLLVQPQWIPRLCTVPDTPPHCMMTCTAGEPDMWQQVAGQYYSIPKIASTAPNHRKNLIFRDPQKTEPPNSTIPKVAKTKQPIKVLHIVHTRISLEAGRSKSCRNLLAFFAQVELGSALQCWNAGGGPHMDRTLWRNPKVAETTHRVVLTRALFSQGAVGTSQWRGHSVNQTNYCSLSFGRWSALLAVTSQTAL